MSYPIQKGVPFPAQSTKTKKDPRGRKPVYPFSKMKIGDSFLVPNKKITSFSSVAATYGANHNKHLVCRTEGTGVRCWYLGRALK